MNSSSNSEMLKNALKGEVFEQSYFYIAHLLDRVLIGECKDEHHMEIIDAYNNSQLLELHLFNEEMEILAARDSGQLTVYEPLMHGEDRVRKVITREYELDSKIESVRASKYKALAVKEYIKYDEITHMANIEKVVLVKLIEGGQYGQ